MGRWPGCYAVSVILLHARTSFLIRAVDVATYAIYIDYMTMNEAGLVRSEM